MYVLVAFYSLLINILVDWISLKTMEKAKIYWDNFVTVMNSCADVLEPLSQFHFSLHLFSYNFCAHFDSSVKTVNRE